VLLSLAALKDADNAQLIEHCRQVARVLPPFGFYLQPAVGGRLLDYAFWRSLFATVEVAAVGAGPVARYYTLDVLRALAAAGRHGESALYTGNDDNIVLDLVNRVRFSSSPDAPEVGFVGGLLGQWAVWTRSAVAMVERLQALTAQGGPIPLEVMVEAA